MKNILYLISIIFFSSTITSGQEIDCKVNINSENLTAEARENLSDFGRKLEEYINNFIWTKDDFAGEKIRCTFDIFFQGSPAENRYIAQVFIGSQRPIYKNEKNTGIMRIFDDKWEFSYFRNQPFYHNNLQFEPLTSFIDFYIKIILGFDYDSYKELDGTKFFQHAFDIANKARSGGGASAGWDIKSSGTYSRYQFIDEIVNPKYKVIREAIFLYHFRGLDLLSKNQNKALDNVLKSIESIANFQKKINEKSLLIKTFFDTKYLELCELFLDSTDPDIYYKLSQYDPSHQKNYDEYKLKRR